MTFIWTGRNTKSSSLPQRFNVFFSPSSSSLYCVSYFHRPKLASARWHRHFSFRSYAKKASQLPLNLVENCHSRLITTGNSQQQHEITTEEPQWRWQWASSCGLFEKTRWFMSRYTRVKSASTSFSASLIQRHCEGLHNVQRSLNLLGHPNWAKKLSGLTRSYSLHPKKSLALNI